MDTLTNYHYILAFKGWAQCRLSTDPDPSNSPRGVSGYTFALPGEPDFDQVIYFQNGPGVVHRSHCPKVGVCVTGGKSFRTRVSEATGREAFDSEPVTIGPSDPFFGAKVDLLGSPIFDSRNSTLVYNGYGLISPFNLQISAKGVSVSRAWYVDPDNPTNDMESIAIADLTPYAMNFDANDPPNPNDSTPGSANILLESGILDQVAYRRRRLTELEQELAESNPQDRNTVAALKKRIAELRIDDPVNRRTAQMGAKVLVPYNLNAKEIVVNGKSTATCMAPWTMEMWLGGWDADSLQFFVLGTVNMVLNFDPAKAS